MILFLLNFNKNKQLVVMSTSKSHFDIFFKKYKDELFLEVKRIQGVIKQTENKISNLTKNEGKILSNSQVSSLLKLAKQTLIKSQEKLEKTEEEYKNLIDGKLDDKVKEKISESRQKQSDIRKDEKKKITMKKEEQQRKRKVLGDWMQKGRDAGAREREYYRAVGKGFWDYKKNCDKNT